MRAKIGMAVVGVIGLAVCLGLAVAQESPKAKSAPPGMVLVPAGEFTMGMSAHDALKECRKFRGDECKRNWFADERPVHTVYLDAFYIDQHEVTQEEYDRCVAAGKCQANEYVDFSGPRQPVVGVSWEDARSYCEWAGKRLPTEAEWEKAARGTDGRIYPWGNERPSCKHAVFDPDPSDAEFGCGRDYTWDVGSNPKGASPYGALDMAGNVWEWTADWYAEDYYKTSPAKNPKGPNTGLYRVVRGGCWSSYSLLVRVTERSNSDLRPLGLDLGFRCAGD